MLYHLSAADTSLYTVLTSVLKDHSVYSLKSATIKMEAQEEEEQPLMESDEDDQVFQEVRRGGPSRKSPFAALSFGYRPQIEQFFSVETLWVP